MPTLFPLQSANYAHVVPSAVCALCPRCSLCSLRIMPTLFPMQSAHYAHVVQELNGLNILVMVESSFMLLCKPLDFASQNIHLQFSVEVIVSNVPGYLYLAVEHINDRKAYNLTVSELPSLHSSPNTHGDSHTRTVRDLRPELQLYYCILLMLFGSA